MRILDLIDLNYGDTLKQGDSTRLRFQLSARDYLLPDNEGKQARIVFHFNNSIVHEEYSTVQRGNVVEFSINEILPPNVYVLEIHVDGQIFPSDDYIFKIKLSAAGIDHEITKSYGINNIIERAVDLVSAKFINLTKEKLGLGNVINVKQASEVEVSQARGSYPTLAERLNETDAQLAQTNNVKLDKSVYETNKIQTDILINKKADQSFVDAQFSSIVSGAPKGTYTDLTSLQSAYPNGAEGVFLVLENGHWYYWNSENNAWTDGGMYQSGGGDWLEAMTEQDQIWSVN